METTGHIFKPYECDGKESQQGQIKILENKEYLTRHKIYIDLSKG